MGENANPAGSLQNPEDLCSRIAAVIKRDRASAIEIGDVSPKSCADKCLVGMVKGFIAKNNYTVVLALAERGAPYYAALMLTGPAKPVLLDVIAYSQTPDSRMAMQVLSNLQKGEYKDLIFSKIAELALREGSYRRGEIPKSCHLF